MTITTSSFSARAPPTARSSVSIRLHCASRAKCGSRISFSQSSVSLPADRFDRHGFKHKGYPMTFPNKTIVPFDADLGALLPAGKPDVQVSRLPYLRLAMPTSRFLYDQGSPIYSLKPNLGDFIVAIGDDEYKVYPGDKGFLFLVAMTASEWKRTDRNGNQVGEPYDTQPEELEWVPNPDRLGKKICIASASGDARTADRYDRQMLVYALVEGLYPQLIYFAKTARPFGDWVANRAARWTIDGKPAPMIGLFRLTSEQTDDGEGHHWYLPKPSCFSKLGQANGPDIAWVRRAAELRRALKGDYGFEIEDPETEPPKIEAQSRVPLTSTLKDGLPAFTTGPQTESDELPPAPPPPDRYDGPDEIEF
jgi:hypothetical protein